LSESWLLSTGLLKIIATALPVGNDENALHGLQAIKESDMTAIFETLAPSLAALLSSAAHRQKTSQAPQPPFAEDAQLDSNTTVESRMTIRNDDISIVNMLQRQVFSLEGIEYYRFELFRMYNLDQIVRVKYSTADKRGTAVPGHHYLPVKGNVVFEKGANLTHFDVVLHDDDGWEPIRTIVVTLDEITKGSADFGANAETTCVCVDDDIYPYKVLRTDRHPIPASEINLPSCIGSDVYLTSDETTDYSLIRNFIAERLTTLYPFSAWGALWSVYRGFYNASTTFLLLVFMSSVYRAETDEIASFSSLKYNDWERIAIGAAGSGNNSQKSALCSIYHVHSAAEK